MKQDILLKELIAEAEEIEKKARALKEASGEGFPSCGFEYDSVDCHACEHFEFCECNEMVRSDAARDLFADAAEKYGVALGMARQAVQDTDPNTDSTESYELLARLLLDIAIHPYTPNFKDCPELWEAQYMWLRLFYRTGEERYLEQARLCDGFRHAYAVEIPDVHQDTVNKLTDQAALEVFALNDQFPEVRCEAVKKLTNKSILQRIAKEDSNGFVRFMAQQRFEDSDALWIAGEIDENVIAVLDRLAPTMSTLAAYEVTCAVCGEKSRQIGLGSPSTCDGTDLDGRPVPHLRHTMQYWLQECPNCGYIERDVSLPAKKTADKLKQCYQPFDELTDTPLAARFAKYARYLSYEGNSSGACDHFLYAAWVYDDMKKATRARTMRRFALDFVHDLADSILRSERCRYMLVKADLLRRMGRFAAVLEMNEKDDALDERDCWQLIFEKELALLGDEAAHSLEEHPKLLSTTEVPPCLHLWKNK